MNARRLFRCPLFVLFAAFVVLLTACKPSVISNSPQPTAEPVILVTQTSTRASGDINLDLSGVAHGQTLQTVAAVPASAGGPAWEAAPQYRCLLLQGYPVTTHLYKAQVFIYPAGELAAANETMGKTAADLQSLLETQQPGNQLPFLPLAPSSRQALDAQVQYLDFKSGKGVRFLTQFNNGPTQINNTELIYTFQGLSSDGKYYISAILPVTHPQLPDTSRVDEQQVLSGFQDYISKTVTFLNQQPAGSFKPDLNKLDALIRSIDVN